MERHITPQMILRLADGTLEPEELGPLLVYHAIETCPTCRQVFLMAQRILGPKLRRDLFETVTDISSWVDPETLRQQAEEDLAELLPLSPEERRLRLDQEDVRFRSPALVQSLVALAWEQLSSAPVQAVELAELGLQVALRIDMELAGDLAFEMIALAAAHKGNALRCCDQPRLAQGCFSFAKGQLALVGGADPLIEAELLSLEASLHIDQRRFKHATRLLRRAEKLFHDVGEIGCRARVLVKQANVFYYEARYDEAVTKLRQAVDLVGDGSRLGLSAQFNLARFLCDAGNVAKARAVLEAYRDRFVKHAGAWTLRLPWLEGRLSQLEGDPVAAEHFFLMARETFLERNAGFDAAEVSLDLALLYLEQGRLDDVQRLAVEMLPTFWSQDVHREVLCALSLFETAAREKRLTVRLVRDLSRFLQHARLDRNLTFESFCESST